MNDYLNYYNYSNNINTYQKNKQIKTNNSLEEPYTGFIRGNMYKNLYNGYKSYKPQELNPQNNKEYLQFLLQMYSFAAHDLCLYLDINPNDSNVIRQRAEYIKMYNEILTQYETNYGPITKNSYLLDATPWTWDSVNWPWEGEN